MKDVFGKDLGGIKFNAAGILKLDKTAKTAEAQKATSQTPIPMKGVYPQGEIPVPQVKSSVTIPSRVLANYEGIGDPSSYRPGGANQTETFYKTLRQAPYNETDRASDEKGHEFV